MRQVVLFGLFFYQRFISPLKPPTCRFYPTCSQYSIQAVEKYGCGKGIVVNC